MAAAVAIESFEFAIGHVRVYGCLAYELKKLMADTNQIV